MKNKTKLINEVPNEFKVDDELIANPETIADCFKSYFFNVAKNMACLIKTGKTLLDSFLAEKANYKLPNTGVHKTQFMVLCYFNLLYD